MKKVKKFLMLFSFVAMLTIIFTISASATEWKGSFFDGDIVYFFEDNTGTMIVKAKDGIDEAQLDTDLGMRAVNSFDGYFSEDNHLSSADREAYLDYPYVDPDVKATKTVILDESVTVLGNFCFDAFSNVETVVLSDGITEIPEGAFVELETLETVVLPENLKEIGKGAFFGCSKLKLNIPSSVETIGDSAFYGCNSENINIPKSVKNIGKDLFVADSPKIYSKEKTENSVGVQIEFEPIQPVTSVKIYSYNKADNSYNFVKEYEIKDAFNFEGQRVSHIFTNLDPNKTYTYSIKTAYTFNGNTVESDYSEHFDVRVNPENLSTVKADSTTNSITLKWKKAAGATTYRIYQKVNSKWKLIGYTYDVSYNVSKKLTLEPCTEYTFAVRPYTRVGNTDVAANKYTAITVLTKPATPNVRVASTAKGRATVAWKDIDGETGYQVWCSTSKNGGYKKLSNYKADTAKIYKTGLESGKTYYFRVRAYTKTDSGYVYSNFSTVRALTIR